MKVGNLFSGIYEIDLGFQKTGLEIAFANETDKDACKTYKYYFKNCNLIEDDVRAINTDYLPCVNVLTAGFPCQSFSVFRNKKDSKMKETIYFLK